jgi:hypothetical protein
MGIPGIFSSYSISTFLDTGYPLECSLSHKDVSKAGKSQIVKAIRRTAGREQEMACREGLAQNIHDRWAHCCSLAGQNCAFGGSAQVV